MAKVMPINRHATWLFSTVMTKYGVFCDNQVVYELRVRVSIAIVMALSPLQTAEMHVHAE